jgi:predicted ester cyclase
MTTIDGAAAVRRLYDEVFNNGDLAVADELVSPGFVSHGGPAGDVTGPEFIKTSARMLAGAFGGMHFDVQDVFATGDRVAARWRMTGTHSGDGLGVPPTGEAVAQEGVVIYRVDEHGLAEQWARVGPADHAGPAAARGRRR